MGLCAETRPASRRLLRIDDFCRKAYTITPMACRSAERLASHRGRRESPAAGRRGTSLSCRETPVAGSLSRRT
jgi:hypothetical protein